MTIARWPNVVTGPLGERMAKFLEHYPKADKIYITSGRDGDHGDIERHGHALGQGHAEAHAGEGTRATANGDTLQGSTRETRLGQQRVGHRQHQFGMATRCDFAAFDHLVAVDQCDGTGFGGGFDGKEVHGVSVWLLNGVP